MWYMNQSLLTAIWLFGTVVASWANWQTGKEPENHKVFMVSFVLMIPFILVAGYLSVFMFMILGAIEVVPPVYVVGAYGTLGALFAEFRHLTLKSKFDKLETLLDEKIDWIEKQGE